MNGRIVAIVIGFVAFLGFLHLDHLGNHVVVLALLVGKAGTHRGMIRTMFKKQTGVFYASLSQTLLNPGQHAGIDFDSCFGAADLHSGRFTEKIWHSVDRANYQCQHYQDIFPERIAIHN